MSKLRTFYLPQNRPHGGQDYPKWTTLLGITNASILIIAVHSPQHAQRPHPHVFLACLLMCQPTFEFLAAHSMGERGLTVCVSHLRRFLHLKRQWSRKISF